jgi:hypothetical protein
MLERAKGLVVICAIVGWPLRRFCASLDRLPDRDTAQSPAAQRVGTVGAVALPIVVPLVWLMRD